MCGAAENQNKIYRLYESKNLYTGFASRSSVSSRASARVAVDAVHTRATVDARVGRTCVYVYAKYIILKPVAQLPMVPGSRGTPTF